MKPTAAVCLFVVCMLGAEAMAHGGGGFRGPSGGVPPGLRGPVDPPGIACDCAQPDCKRCSHPQLLSGRRLARSDVVETVTRRWDDFAALRIVATFRGAGESRPIEAYAMLAPSAAFAATAGTIRQGDSTLTAALRASRDARRRYLWAKQNGLDPFLVTRRGAGRYHLRAFPVRSDGDTVVEVDGFALAPPRARGAPRFYRTGDRVLVVRDTRAGDPVDADAWRDAGGKRELWFGTADAARARFGDRVDAAAEVPFVPAIETAITGRGAAAASADTALVALEPSAGLPPHVGPATAPDPPPPAG